jgi:FkbM family methyltransferase
MRMIKQLKRYYVNKLLQYSRPRDYSQYGEGKELASIFARLGITPQGGVDYIDVGANQPAVISNTYGLYREGFRGILVEPNLELYGLLRSVRPYDKVIAVGCGSAAGVASFHQPEASVLAYLGSPQDASTLVPVLTVDQIAQSLGIRQLPLLSVDVEGMNIGVLQGAKELLAQTMIVVVEFDDDADRQALTDLLAKTGHAVIRTLHCNLLAVRNDRPSSGAAHF